MNKKKCIIGILAILCLLYVGIHLYNNNGKVSDKDLHSSDSKSAKNYDTLENIRNSIEQVSEDIESGVYSNLSGEKISIYMTESDEICSKVSEYRKWENYNGITDTREMLDYELAFIQFFLGTDLNPKYLIDGASVNDNFDSDNSKNRAEELEEYPFNNYEKVCGMMEEGTYISQYGDGMPRLGYSNGFNIIDYSDEYRYAYYISGQFNIEKGKLNKILAEDAWLEHTAVYMFTDDGLDDRYTLPDGNEVSIKECMDTATEYLEKIPYKGMDGIELQAVRADVYCLHSNEENRDTDSIYDGKYVIDVIFARKYKGVCLDFGNRYSTNLDYMYDCTTLSVIEKNEIEEILEYGNNAHLEDIDKDVNEIIDLASAMDILNNTIGNNSKYEVLNIGLVYRQKNLKYKNDGNIYEKYELTPSWHIDCISEINSEPRTFYIDALTGGITYVDGVFSPWRTSN